MEFLEKRPFFQADMAGLGKYSTGGYGRIGVYRVNNYYLTNNIYGNDGALDEGSPMSPIDFKKWQCPLSLFFRFSCRF